MQNFAFGLSGDPQEEHPFVLMVCLGISAGSGVGNVPGSPNDSCAETIPGGPPTGFSAVPALGGCHSRTAHHSRLSHSWHQSR